MNHRPFLTACSLILTPALLLVAGCVAAPSHTNAARSVTYQPARSAVQLDAPASVQIEYVLTPEMRTVWLKSLDDEVALENYRQTVRNLIVNDLTQSGIFTRVSAAAPAPDGFLLRIKGEELRTTDCQLRITITVVDADTNQVISTHGRQQSTGERPVLLPTKPGSARITMTSAVYSVMNALKGDMIPDLQTFLQRRQQQAFDNQIAALRTASLTDLLVAADKTEALARERNRALVAAKNQQLPAILREKKTDELSALVVKIEQTILDLNHECELAKDQAQQSVASGDTPRDNAGLARQRGLPDAVARARGLPMPVASTPDRGIEELRGLAISYRERIELLKPILTALKEEIANRNR
jgi:hypothetical protein